MTSETSSVDKSEPVAVAPCDSEPAVPTVKPAATKKIKKSSKAKVKAVVAAVAATQAEEDRISNLSLDHPYLSVLYKRIRSHRKKLEKIKGLEQARANEGKQPNAQQLELMGHKASLEKLVAELEMLREQFVGVFSQELEQKRQQEQQEKVKEPVTAAVEQVDEAEVAEQEDETQEVTEQEERAPGQPQETQEQQEKVEEVDDQVHEFSHVYELLKTLHVVNLHQALGKEVPMVLDFFSKVLLGNTRPPAELSYEENLMESLEEAKKYLTDNDKVFACDTTYSGLRAFVDELATISSGKTEEEEVEVAEEEEEKVGGEPAEEEAGAETLYVPVVPAEINTMPQISFFTESQLESEQGDDVIIKVEQVTVNEEKVEVTEIMTIETQEEPVMKIIKDNQVENQVLVDAPPAPESVPAPPLSFAAVAAGVSSERTPSPSASSGSSSNEKKEDNSPRGKNSRRRGQGRWREKGSNSSSGNKSGNGSPTNGGKPHRPRVPRKNDENNGTQGEKRSGSMEGRRPRVDRALRKQGNASQQHEAPMIAPHA